MIKNSLVCCEVLSTIHGLMVQKKSHKGRLNKYNTFPYVIFYYFKKIYFQRTKRNDITQNMIFQEPEPKKRADQLSNFEIVSCTNQ